MAIQFGMATMVFGGVPIGHLQNVTMDFSYDVAKLYSGNTVFPVDVRVHTGTVSGNAEFADLTAVAFEKILGGSLTGDTMSLTNTDRPEAFSLVCSLVTDGISFSITFPKVRSTKLSLAFVRDGHLIPNFDFEIEADTDGSVATIDIGDVS